jgi:hypothetical protein
MIRLTADPVTSNSTQGSEGSGVLEAMKLVREGRFIRLDHLWEPGRNGVLGNIAIETIRGTPRAALQAPLPKKVASPAAGSPGTISFGAAALPLKLLT